MTIDFPQYLAFDWVSLVGIPATRLATHPSSGGSESKSNYEAHPNGRKGSQTPRYLGPVLDAAHIKPYSVLQRHEVSNGMLMRSDLHRLFDEGYLTIDPAYRKIVVSKRIREEFENGKEYYKLDGQPVRDPAQAIYRPHADNLEYHAYNIFR